MSSMNFFWLLCGLIDHGLIILNLCVDCYGLLSCLLIDVGIVNGCLIMIISIFNNEGSLLLERGELTGFFCLVLN